MKKKTATLTVLAIMVICISSAVAAMRARPEPAALTQAGEKLLASYSGQLNAVKAEIEKALPKINEQKRSAYLEALQAEKAAQADRDAKDAALKKNLGHVGLLNHRKDWIGRATKGVAEAKVNLKKAQAIIGEKAQAVKEAQEALAKIQANYNDAASELKKAQALVDDAKLEEPKLVKALAAAENALTLAKANAMRAAKELDMRSFLTSDRLDAKLAKYQVLAEATPQGLAEYAQQGKTQEALINKLLADDDLMIQMAVAGGAKAGKYGQAMEIYTDIQKSSSKAKSGVLQRLALGSSLEHAVPIAQRNATGLTNAPATVNPVNRYLHFEKAYLDNALDPAFKVLSVWDYRMVVNGEEPDEILTWGRKMLANYRPDQISKKDSRWRYVESVRTEIKYGSGDNKYDQDDLQFFQNILKNGGVCGRRAFFGRFILRSFGIPTTARPQRAHATLVHWTPEGWVICLGAGWGHGWVNGPEAVGRGRIDDTIFLAQTQARMTGKPYMQVWRAKTAGALQASGIWDSISLYRQRAIIEEAKAVTLAAVGTDIGEANETREKVDIINTAITKADKEITVGRDGTITIPAAACSKPTQSTGKIIFMPSNLGGKQLHYSRTGGNQEFEYTFNAPKAGQYALTARVVTPSWKQHLRVKANGAAEPIDIALPFTVGMWDKTQPVEITLARGKNVLTFSREHEGLKGVTIRDFTLKPVQ
ncbi:MAG: hypothetical protein K9M57_08950 [Phycisphaerae bacterium]|nr:hypothetical protein [Phycisphaerae bacterium]